MPSGDGQGRWARRGALAVGFWQRMANGFSELLSLWALARGSQSSWWGHRCVQYRPSTGQRTGEKRGLLGEAGDGIVMAAEWCCGVASHPAFFASRYLAASQPLAWAGQMHVSTGDLPQHTWDSLACQPTLALGFSRTSPLVCPLSPLRLKDQEYQDRADAPHGVIADAEACGGEAWQ